LGAILGIFEKIGRFLSKSSVHPGDDLLYLQMLRRVRGEIVQPQLDAASDRLSALLARERVVVVGHVTLKD